MDIEGILSTIATVSLVLLAVQYMKNAAKKPVAPKETGEYELRINRLYQLIGWVPLALALASAVILLTTESEDAWIGVLLLLFWAALGAGLLMFYNNYRLLFNDERILVRNWLGKTKELHWADISDMSVNQFSGMISVKGAEKKLRIHLYLVGLVEFARKIEEKTAWTAMGLKLPVQ